MHVWGHDCMKSYCFRGTRTQPLISVKYPVQLIGENFLRLHLCRHRFASLWGASTRCASLWRADSRGDSWSCSKTVIHPFLDCLLKMLFIFFFIVGAAFATVFLTRELVSILFAVCNTRSQMEYWRFSVYFRFVDRFIRSVQLGLTLDVICLETYKIVKTIHCSKTWINVHRFLDIAITGILPKTCPRLRWDQAILSFSWAGKANRKFSHLVHTCLPELCVLANRM